MNDLGQRSLQNHCSNFEVLPVLFSFQLLTSPNRCFDIGSITIHCITTRGVVHNNPILYPFTKRNVSLRFTETAPFWCRTPQTTPAPRRRTRGPTECPRATELLGPRSRSACLMVPLSTRSTSHPNQHSVRFHPLGLFPNSSVLKIDFNCIILLLFYYYIIGIECGEFVFVLLCALFVMFLALWCYA